MVKLLLETIEFSLDELMSKKYKAEGLPPISQYYKLDTTQCEEICREIKQKIELKYGHLCMEHMKDPTPIQE